MKNPLHSLYGTVLSGLVATGLLAALVGLPLAPGGTESAWIPPLLRWIHLAAGAMWLGLLYYFTFVQAAALQAAAQDGSAAGITRHVQPRALAFFRWAAVVTWMAGALLLVARGEFVAAFTLQGSAAVIGTGAWLGTVMLLNVWLLIWPCQQKLLGLVAASEEEKARARGMAAVSARVNLALSVPMLFFMAAAGHGTGLF